MTERNRIVQRLIEEFGVKDLFIIEQMGIGRRTYFNRKKDGFGQEEINKVLEKWGCLLKPKTFSVVDRFADLKSEKYLEQVLKSLRSTRLDLDSIKFEAEVYRKKCFRNRDKSRTQEEYNKEFEESLIKYQKR